MEPNVSPKEIRDIFIQQRDIAHSLGQLLTQEHTAISGKNLQGIESTLAAKQQLMEGLEAFSRELLARISQYSPDKKVGVVVFLRRLDPQGTWGLESLWQQINELLSQCRQKNSTNGKIISLNHRHIQQALEILRGEVQNPQACYSSTGTHQAPVSSRILGKI